MILAIIIILVFISIIDIVFKRIPDLLNIILYFYALSYVLWNGIEECFLGSVIGLIVFILGYFLSNGSLGEGDIKLIPSFGLMIGYPGILNIILYSSLLSSVVFILNNKKKAYILPYAPFLSISFLFIFILQSSSF
jgi:Flp pilus assembly protein protease CpaA